MKKNISFLMIICVIFILSSHSFSSNDIGIENNKNVSTNTNYNPKPDKYNKPFIFFGLSLGTPGLLNITIGTYCEIFGFQASFSFLHIIDAILTGESDDKYENNIEEEDDYSFAFIQLNANVKLYKTRNFLLSFSIGGGTYHIDDEGELQNNMSIFYIGPCFHIFYYNLFLELGIAYGKDFETKLENESTGLLPMVQIGYMKRLL